MRSNRSIPPSTVIPELGYPDLGAAVDWLCAAFGFTLRLRIAEHRAQLNVGAGAVVLTALPVAEIESPRDDVAAAHAVLVRVEHVDRHCEQARAHGARIIRPPEDHPYGERQYTTEDLAGHRWTFSESIADVDPEDWGGTPGEL